MKARLKLTVYFPEGSSLSVMSQPLRRGYPEMAEDEGLASGAVESHTRLVCSNGLIVQHGETHTNP